MPERHEAVAIEVIVTQADGTKLVLESHEFDYIEFEVQRPTAWWGNDYLRAYVRDLPSIIVTIKNAGKYTMRHPSINPAIEADDIVEEGQ